MFTYGLSNDYGQNKQEVKFNDANTPVDFRVCDDTIQMTFAANN